MPSGDEKVTPEMSGDEDENRGTTSEDDRSSDSLSSESEEESSSDDSETSDSLWEAFVDGDKKQTQGASMLSIAPKNTGILLNLGVKSVASGDVDFAKFVSHHAEGSDATDALLSALYLSQSYHGNDFCDNIYVKNRRYDEVQILTDNITKEMARRLLLVEEHLNSIPIEENVSLPGPVAIIFDAE